MGKTGNTLEAAPAGRGAGSQAVALTEVALVLAAAHLACRAFKQFTPLGQAERAAGLNFSPGWTMALFAFVVLVICRRSWTVYGVDPRAWPQELGQAMARLAERSRISVAWWWAAMAGLFVVTFVAGLINRSLGDLLWLMAWQFFATAVGEEVFFRGYAQTRLNEVFPRRWSIRGIAFGPGLFLMALLFGLLHAFNSVDYFNGRFTFAWTLAGSTFLSALLFGLLREATGSIAPGIVLHFLNNMQWFTLWPTFTSWLLRH